MIVLDSSFVYALLDEADRTHTDAVRWYEAVDEELATTPLVLAEVDHLVLRRGDRAAASALHADIKNGAYRIDWWEGAAAIVVDVADAYAEFPLGLTDASLVALAAHHETTRVATFDLRHFRAVRPLTGADAFTVLPADA